MRLQLFLAAAVVAGSLLTAVAYRPGEAIRSIANGNSLPADSIRAIARDAYLYGFPMVENYRILYRSSMDTAYAKYAPFNRFFHEQDVAGPDDTLFVAPNGDTPYSYAVINLKAEPVVLTIPPIPPGRYAGFPLYDLYTHIITTLSRRTIGDGGGSFLIAGQGWKGKTPVGIRAVIRSETDLVYTIVRTQLLGRDDLPRVHALQQQYRLEPLSAFEGRKTPVNKLRFTHLPLAPQSPMVAPSTAFFDLLNYLLTFCQPHPSEATLLRRFAQIGIVPGKAFAPIDSATKTALLAGMTDGQEAMLALLPKVRSAAELYGTRQQLQNNYLARAVGAWVGIYANQPEEFMGLAGYEAQPDGKPFDGHNRYSITFPAGQLPPVDAFWSITVYRLPSRFMYANPLNRNVISSNMLSRLKTNPDGSITLLLQHQSPGAEWEANWLPVPEGPFSMSFRTYLPGEAIRTGRYQPPPVVMQPNLH